MKFAVIGDSWMYGFEYVTQTITKSGGRCYAVGGEGVDTGSKSDFVHQTRKAVADKAPYILVYGGLNSYKKSGDELKKAFKNVVAAANGTPIYICTCIGVSRILDTKVCKKDYRDFNSSITNKINPAIRACGATRVLEIEQYKDKFPDSDYSTPCEHDGFHLRSYNKLWNYIQGELNKIPGSPSSATSTNTNATTFNACDNSAISSIFTNRGEKRVNTAIHIFRRLLTEPMIGVTTKKKGGPTTSYQLTPQQVCGMVANFVHENIGNYDGPPVTDPQHNTGDNELSYGFMGWNDKHGGWQFLDWFKRHNKNWKDLDAQIDFLLTNTESPNSIARNMEWIDLCTKYHDLPPEEYAYYFACYQEVCAHCCKSRDLLGPHRDSGTKDSIVGNNWKIRWNDAQKWWTWYNKNKDNIAGCDVIGGGLGDVGNVSSGESGPSSTADDPCKKYTSGGTGGQSQQSGASGSSQYSSDSNYDSSGSSDSGSSKTKKNFLGVVFRPYKKDLNNTHVPQIFIIENIKELWKGFRENTDFGKKKPCPIEPKQVSYGAPTIQDLSKFWGTLKGTYKFTEEDDVVCVMGRTVTIRGEWDHNYEAMNSFNTQAITNMAYGLKSLTLYYTSAYYWIDKDISASNNTNKNFKWGEVWKTQINKIKGNLPKNVKVIPFSINNTDDFRKKCTEVYNNL